MPTPFAAVAKSEDEEIYLTAEKEPESPSAASAEKDGIATEQEEPHTKKNDCGATEQEEPDPKKNGGSATEPKEPDTKKNDGGATEQEEQDDKAETDNGFACKRSFEDCDYYK